MGEMFSLKTASSYVYNVFFQTRLEMKGDQKSPNIL